MTRERLDKFGAAVREFNLCPDDLKKVGVHKVFNEQLNNMDAAYGKDEAIYNAAESVCLGILKQVGMAKRRVGDEN